MSAWVRATTGAVACAFALAAAACASRAPNGQGPDGREAPSADAGADVIAVQAQGQPGSYTFSVAISSPDTGCARYADWWEVVSADGRLVYRRILAHSHPTEQPFTRSGGPVAIAADDEVVVRAHMNTTGYGGAAMRGTVAGGFTADQALSASFAAELAQEAPLPDGCAF